MPRDFVMLSACLPLLLISCSPEPEQLPPIKRAKPPKPAAEAPEQAPAPVQEASEDGRPTRNPFLSYVVLLGNTGKPKKVRGPLECCEINLFKLVAVVKGKDDAYALVQAPDSKRYIVKRGTVIGLRDGRVTRIDTGSITVRERTRDASGKVVSMVDEKISLPVKKGTAP